MMRAFWRFQSPVGWLTLCEEDGFLTTLSFGQPDYLQASLCATPLMTEAQAQLNAYFAGELQKFRLPLAPSGTLFQQRCWQALQEIPYGQTRTYSQQATAVGSPKATRAVGMANHRNPLPILIPCHRVIGKNGQLTGYAGGMPVKQFLLSLERKAVCGG